jgi:hypothetical protein
MALPDTRTGTSELALPIFLDRNPTLFREDWLPEHAPWKELRELRKEHLEHLATRRDLDEQLSALSKKYGVENRAYDEAVRASYKDKKKTTVLPSITSAEDREATMGPLRLEFKLAQDEFDQWAQDAVRLIAEKREEWADSFGNVEEQAEAIREEANALMRKADALAEEPRRYWAWARRAAPGSYAPPPFATVMQPQGAEREEE